MQCGIAKVQSIFSYGTLKIAKDYLLFPGHFT
jgi:hypothetical protein